MTCRTDPTRRRVDSWLTMVTNMAVHALQAIIAMEFPPTDCLFDWAESEQVTVYDAAGQLIVKVPLQLVKALPEDMQDWTFYLKLIGAAIVYEDGCNLVNVDGQLVDFTEAVVPGVYKITFAGGLFA